MSHKCTVLSIFTTLPYAQPVPVASQTAPPRLCTPIDATLGSSAQILSLNEASQQLCLRTGSHQRPRPRSIGWPRQTALERGTLVPGLPLAAAADMARWRTGEDWQRSSMVLSTATVDRVETKREHF